MIKSLDEVGRSNIDLRAPPEQAADQEGGDKCSDTPSREAPPARVTHRSDPGRIPPRNRGIKSPARASGATASRLQTRAFVQTEKNVQILHGGSGGPLAEVVENPHQQDMAFGLFEDV